MALAQHFIRKFNEKNSAQVSERIGSDVLTILEAHSSPGNVRDLENVIKRLAMGASDRGIITEADAYSVLELNQLGLKLPSLKAIPIELGPHCGRKTKAVREGWR